MKLYYVFMYLLLSYLNGYSQRPDFGLGSRIIVSTLKVTEDTRFHIYNPSFIAKAIYKDSLEAVNTYPEQLMSSLISASNQSWVDYNVMGGEVKSEKKDPKYFEFIKEMSFDKNYFDLKSKLTFNFNKREYAIIKFYFYTESLPEPTSGAYVMVKDSGRWKYTTTNFTSDLALMLMRFKEEKIQELIFFQNTDNEFVNKVLARVSPSSGVIDFGALYIEFSSWYDENKIEYLNYFIDENAW